MSKYRVVFKRSRIELAIGCIIAGLFVLSFWCWKAQILPFQWLIQSVLSILVCVHFFKWLKQQQAQKVSPVIFTVDGQWTELEHDSWLITQQSRISRFVLFINLSSVLNAAHSKWFVVYHDQVSEQEYRRLCRAIIFQQQKTDG
ncbi:protein YgfX [Paraglaciecola aquimarina]|uniref:Protein YgfX n=1 Tax=Paraglaciecola aquimarina TaxID=1235557 RepID=A0ABU3SWJ9_9ALTE|nr:protein YgfX [Paraglaciecola aquimarina]MDU0354379.1 protein YgfX [Paraglaciecola aquimarina]